MKNLPAVLLLWITIYYKGQVLSEYFDTMENPNLAQHSYTSIYKCHDCPNEIIVSQAFKNCEFHSDVISSKCDENRLQ